MRGQRSEGAPARAVDPRARLPTAALAAVLALTVVVYLPGLGGPLLLDDAITLAPLADWAGGRIGWRDVVLGGEGGPTGRPVAMASLLANVAITGDDVRALKATNLAIHLACGVALFLLARGLVTAAGATPRAGAGWIALWVAAAWLLAPLLASTVLYVTQRMAQLAALFAFAGLAGYVAGRRRMRDAPRRGAWIAAGSIAVGWPLATLSKENGALLPLLALGVEACCFRFAGPPPARRFLAALFGLTVALPGLAALGLAVARTETVLGGYAWRDFTAGERLLTEARAVVDYAAGLLVLPGSTAPGIYHDDYAVSRGLLDPPTTALAIAALVAAAGFAVRARAPAARVAGAGIAIYLAGHLLESTLIPLELYFEHRAYLPGAGVVLAAGVAAFAAASRTRLARVLIPLVALVPLGFAALTLHRATTWSSLERVLRAAERTHPGSARVHGALATLEAGRGRLEPALDHLARAARAEHPPPADAIAVHRLVAYCVAGRTPPEAAYRALEAHDVLHAGAYLANGVAWLADAVAADRCPHVDAARVAAALAPAATVEGPHAEKLRAHVARLRRAEKRLGSDQLNLLN